MQTRSSGRRRGRPKTTGASGKAQELRREQIRTAQRAYRIRRDDRIRALEEAHADLTARHELMEASFFEICEEAARCSSPTLEPSVATLIQESTARFFSDRLVLGATPSSHEVAACSGFDAPRDESRHHDASAEGAFGYLVPDDAEIGLGALQQHSSGGADNLSWPCDSFPTPVSPLSPPSLPPPSTYSFLEATFARRLQRRSLELAYQIFDDPNSDPQAVYRTFRLVGCFKDRAKMRPYFQRLLRADPGQSLELYGLPFYCIGGAGTHYPRASDVGSPPNLRLPRRILGVASGGPAGTDEEACAESLVRMGYGGTWFDSREVECYLEERGVHPQAHSSVVPISGAHPTSPGEPGEAEQEAPQAQMPSRRRDRSTHAVATSPVHDLRPGNKSGKAEPASTTTLYFDTDRFLECLCSQDSILGRAPGFRKEAVDAAINQALRRG